ncbi:shikimate kinase [Pseudomaricurvus alkylphenolicus]|jgi:shikimate kinase|uniref:shikimate kinase n=1 Tax=Pseudomaricurvus alkylphenolicus TaxID=1306991 RepID=UPI00141E2660|nr:shikimate kinase [Pseudomaricurvus alkylphenolicus]NIB43571.1 shikimate kinase [Pseudomaricurvus alkylphenolicus]
MNKESVILVGMPGAGKSTLGVMLAKALARDFVDTDLLIQLRAGATLQEILDEKGYQALRRLEEETLLGCDFRRHVIATGGSVVYSDAGMRHLKQYGPVVYLDVELDELRRRIHDYETRGIAKRPDQSFESLFEERRALYQRYADIVVNCNGVTQEESLEQLLAALRAG